MIMWLIYNVQFYAFSGCVYLFTLFTLAIYYAGIISSVFQEIQPEYDYIIVGSGTAGSVIAHRLATETDCTFIVLEAGTRSNAFYEIPAAGPALHRSLHDWMFETVPQEFACHAMEGQKCRLPQGKIVGGSSKLNNMVHVRGNISHYVNWFHGKHTPQYLTQQFEYIENKLLHLDSLQFESDIVDAVISASLELGYEKLDKEYKRGFSKSRLSQKYGKRWTTSDNVDSKHIIKNALVEKVFIENNVAKGVDFEFLGTKKYVRAKKGVILSAGTYNTPKILQLSGIGPAKLLTELGIDIVKELPVGHNLQDHVATGLDLVLFDNYFKIKAEDTLHPLSLFDYFLKGKGPLTMPGCEVVGFLSTNNSSIPDLQFMVLPFGLALDRGSHLRKAVGIKDNVWDRYFVKLFDKYTATVMPIVLHPKSKGTVFIHSKNPMIPPLIDPKYLSHKDDKNVLIQGLKLVKKLVETKSLKTAGAYMNPLVFPGCGNFKIFSDSYWDCYIKHLTFGSYHPVGTCSMGLPGSKKSVVDTSFKVLGVQKLYVADASVLPTLPSGNINAAVCMMASVFFDTNIAKTYEDSWKEECFKADFLNYVLKMCIAETKVR